MIVHGYDMGVAHDGGYAERVRVPADWVVRRPESMTAFDAMTLGTAGYTAALAIELMQHNGLAPDNGPVAVTGATGGVGSVAIDILAKLGYHVVAITGKGEEADYLKGIGAKEVVLRQSLDLTKIRPLDRATFAGAIDNLGGDILAWLLSTPKIGGTVASVGLAAGYKLNTTVMPFILRGVHLLGVDSVEHADAAAPADLEQAGRRMAARPRARPGAHDRLRRAAHAFRSLSQGTGARAHRRAHRAGHARRLTGAGREA